MSIIFIDSVIQLTPTINGVQTVIKFWLQHAGDRIKYEVKKIIN